MHLIVGKLLKCHLVEEFCRKWTVSLNINNSEKKKKKKKKKKNGTQGFICPHPGAIYMYWICESSFLIYHGGHHDLIVCPR